MRARTRIYTQMIRERAKARKPHVFFIVEVCTCENGRYGTQLSVTLRCMSLRVVSNLNQEIRGALCALYFLFSPYIVLASGKR